MSEPQYFTLPHLFCQSPADSSRLHQTLEQKPSISAQAGDHFFCWSPPESAEILADSSRLQHPATAMPVTAWLPPVRVWVWVRVRVQVRVQIRVRLGGYGGIFISWLAEIAAFCLSPGWVAGVHRLSPGWVQQTLADSRRKIVTWPFSENFVKFQSGILRQIPEDSSGIGGAVYSPPELWHLQLTKTMWWRPLEWMSQI